MKDKWISKLAILVLAFSGALSLSAFAQTTEDGSGPTEQPSAPMEVGQDQPQDSGRSPQKRNRADPVAKPRPAQIKVWPASA
jgi:hypothetical protein